MGRLNAPPGGRMRQRQLLVDGVATAAGWPALVKTASEGLRLDITFGGEGYGASDHATFTGAKIPVAFLFTGVHEDYHLPSDTADKINVDGIAVTSVLAARLATAFAPDESVSPDPFDDRDEHAATNSAAPARTSEAATKRARERVRIFSTAPFA